MSNKQIQIERLIMNQDALELDSIQVRGEWACIDGVVTYVGYDYELQQWIEFKYEDFNFSKVQQ